MPSFRVNKSLWKKLKLQVLWLKRGDRYAVKIKTKPSFKIKKRAKLLQFKSMRKKKE